jgi:hypothetical protein
MLWKKSGSNGKSGGPEEPEDSHPIPVDAPRPVLNFIVEESPAHLFSHWPKRGDFKNEKL